MYNIKYMQTCIILYIHTIMYIYYAAVVVVDHLALQYLYNDTSYNA